MVEKSGESKKRGRALATTRTKRNGSPPSATAPSQATVAPNFLTTAILDGISANIAILNSAGVIITVNRAWREFAVENGVPAGQDFVGQNYLAVCERSRAGDAAAVGIRELLFGRRQDFYLEYPCHGPDERRWFCLRATLLEGDPNARVVLVHENITARSLAEQSFRRAREELESRVRDRTDRLAEANRALYTQIAEREASEAALQESNDRLRLALRAGMTGIWQINFETGQVTRSDSTDMLFALTPGGPSRPLADYFNRMHPDDAPAVQQTIERAIENAVEQYVEYRVLLPDGNLRWIASRGLISRDETSGAMVMVGASVDITQRKVTEEALRDSEERYRLLFESNPHPMWVSDSETLAFLAVNDAALKFYGYSREEFQSKTIRDIRPEEDLPRLDNFLATRAIDAYSRGIWRHRKKSGEIVSVEVISHTVSFAGKPARIVLSNDVTDRLAAEEGLRLAHLELEERVRVRTAQLARTNEALRESEELFRQIAENIGEVFWMTNLDKSQMIYISPAYESIWGRSCQSLYERPVSFLDAIVEEDRPLVVANLPAQAKGETTVTYRVLTAGGQEHWVRDRSFPIRNRAGEIYRVAGIAENITDLKRTEEELSRLAAIAESSDDAIFGESLDGKIISWNSGARRIYGYTADEIVGKPAAVLMLPEHLAEAAELLGRVTRSEPVASFEAIRVRKNGERFSVSLTLSAVRDTLGQLIAVSAIERDITERKRLEREILEIGERERQRIGQDLHDGLGQHLTGIAFLSKALQQQLAAGQRTEAADAGQIAELVREAIGQARALARGLHPVQPSPNGLMSALQEMAARVEPVFRIACKFVCPRPVAVKDNNVATHLYRIAQEAVNNAIKHGAARHIRIILEGGKHMAITVEDDGQGIPVTISDCTYEAGEECLPSDQHGMGLRIMSYRAKMIGGTLAIRRGVAGGTIVTCSLPPRPSRTPPTAFTSPASAHPDGVHHDAQRPTAKSSPRRTPSANRRTGQGKGVAGRRPSDRPPGARPID